MTLKIGYNRSQGNDLEADWSLVGASRILLVHGLLWPAYVRWQTTECSSVIGGNCHRASGFPLIDPLGQLPCVHIVAQRRPGVDSSAVLLNIAMATQ